MDITRALHIATSALDAQRQRMDLISGNLANAYTTRTDEGGPYKRKNVTFEAVASEVGDDAESVEVGEILADETEGPRLFDPGHPDADEDGYVTYPNVDVMTEMVDMMSATRAYEAALTAAETVRDMAKKSLEIGR